MREPLFRSAFMTFLKVLFGTLGLIFAITIGVLMLSGSGGALDGNPEIKYKFKPEILPNADGVRKEFKSDTAVILQINIHGVIGLHHLTHDNIAKQLVEANERQLKGKVKAILLNMNTPGGAAIDADGIYREILKYKEEHKIPVFVYVDGMCASGGMYVAAAADKVFASDTSIFGSVGVIIPTLFNFSKLLDKVGIDTMTIYDGKGKDALNPMRPWVAGEEDNIKDLTKFYYNTFVDVVIKGRKGLDRQKLIDVYGANIYPAPIAKEYGFIDETGANLSSTLKHLVETLGIQDNHYHVITLKDSSWFFDYFGEKESVMSGQVTHRLDLPQELDAKLSNQYLYLYRP